MDRIEALSTAVTARQRRGYTLIEILVVISIILVLMFMVVGGLISVTRGQKLTASTERVARTISLARNLAIGDKAITHVRVFNQDGDTQLIGIYRFTETSDALKANTEMAVDAMGGWWSQNAALGPFQNKQLEMQKLEQGIFFETNYDTAKLWNNPRNMPVSQYALHSSATAGVSPDNGDLYYSGRWISQGPFPAYGAKVTGDAANALPKTATYDINGALISEQHAVLYFYPDGTASNNVLLLVRDETGLQYVQVWKSGLIKTGQIRNVTEFGKL